MTQNMKSNQVHNFEIFPNLLTCNKSNLGPDLPLGLNRHAIVKLNDSVSILIGGNADSLHYSPKTFYYIEDNKEWVPGPDLIHGRWGHSAGIVTDSMTDKEYLVVIGGRNEMVLSCIEIFNEVENRWEKGTVFQI